MTSRVFFEKEEGKEFLKILMGTDEPEELQYCWDDLARTADANGDGKVSRDEFLLYYLGAEELTEDGAFVDADLGERLAAELRKLEMSGADYGGLRLPIMQASAGSAPLPAGLGTAMEVSAPTPVDGKTVEVDAEGR